MVVLLLKDTHLLFLIFLSWDTKISGYTFVFSTSFLSVMIANGIWIM